MTAKTIDCIDCGASVPYGRLSCPACGALLASVGGRPPVGLEPVVTPGPAAPQESFLLPDDPLPASAPADWPLPDETPPVLAGRPYRRPVSDDPPAPPNLTSLPGSYRTPGLMLSGAVADGPAWPVPVAVASAASVPDSAAATIRSRVGPLDPARFAEIAGWFVVVGATMAILGFLLPWSTVVIGARGVGSYFDTWGLASPTHVVVLAATMVVLALGIVRSAVPVWLRSGVLPLALGSLLIGLAWPYQVGPLGADVGAFIVALGGLALVIGGVVATWATRHVDPDLPV